MAKVKLYIDPKDGSKKPIIEDVPPLTITIRKRHIKKGQAGNEFECAAAVCTVEQTGAEWARFERTVNYIGFADRVERRANPRSLQNAIIQFDVLGGVFAPTGSYTLKAMRPSERLSAKHVWVERAKREGGARKPQGPVPQRGKRYDPLHLAGVRWGHGSGVFLEVEA